MKILVGILLFSAIILFHELGHFLLAKKNGVCVHEFTLGLGPTLIGKEYHGTKYCLKLLPFGGSCMMKGEEEEDSAPDSFQSKTPWQRFQIVFAGPFFNFILAFLLAFFLVAINGASLPIPNKVSGGAKEAGLQPGDRIVQIDNKRIHLSSEITLYGILHQEKPEVLITYIRDGKKHQTEVVRTKEDNRYIVGLSDMKPVKVSPPEIMINAFYESKMQVDMVFESFAYLFSGRGSIKDVSGPVGIVGSISSVYDAAKVNGIGAIVLAMMSFGMMLSANLGVMNLLPIPALDGGRIVFIFGEMITKKKLPTKIETYINTAGLAFLMGLIAIITFKDIFIH